MLRQDGRHRSSGLPRRALRAASFVPRPRTWPSTSAPGLLSAPPVLPMTPGFPAPEFPSFSSFAPDPQSCQAPSLADSYLPITAQLLHEVFPQLLSLVTRVSLFPSSFIRLPVPQLFTEAVLQLRTGRRDVVIGEPDELSVSDWRSGCPRASRRGAVDSRPPPRVINTPGGQAGQAASQQAPAPRDRRGRVWGECVHFPFLGSLSCRLTPVGKGK